MKFRTKQPDGDGAYYAALKPTADEAAADLHAACAHELDQAHMRAAKAEEDRADALGRAFDAEQQVKLRDDWIESLTEERDAAQKQYAAHLETCRALPRLGEPGDSDSGGGYVLIHDAVAEQTGIDPQPTPATPLYALVAETGTEPVEADGA